MGPRTGNNARGVTISGCSTTAVNSSSDLAADCNMRKEAFHVGRGLRFDQSNLERDYDCPSLQRAQRPREAECRACSTVGRGLCMALINLPGRS